MYKFGTYANMLEGIDNKEYDKSTMRCHFLLNRLKENKSGS